MMLRKEHEDEVLTGATQPASTADRAAVAPASGGVAPGPGTWLSPGLVVAVAADHVVLELASKQRVKARMALAIPYEAALGDELLVLGGASQAYVTGVLQGRGQNSLVMKGDVRLAAEGKLSIASTESITFEAPVVETRAEAIHTVAGRVTEVFDSVRKTVRQLLAVRAGEQNTLVEGTSQLVAKNARTLSEGKVTINGKEIFLG